jgi:hypothetical protein
MAKGKELTVKRTGCDNGIENLRQGLYGISRSLQETETLLAAASQY